MQPLVDVVGAHLRDRRRRCDGLRIQLRRDLVAQPGPQRIAHDVAKMSEPNVNSTTVAVDPP